MGFFFASAGFETGFKSTLWLHFLAEWIGVLWNLWSSDFSSNYGFCSMMRSDSLCVFLMPGKRWSQKMTHTHTLSKYRLTERVGPTTEIQSYKRYAIIPHFNVLKLSTWCSDSKAAAVSPSLSSSLFDPALCRLRLVSPLFLHTLPLFPLSLTFG